MKAAATRLHLALEGDGYFVFEPLAASATRAMVALPCEADGTVITPGGDPLLGEDGPIQLDGASMVVSADGTVSLDNNEIGKLRIVRFKDAG